MIKKKNVLLQIISSFFFAILGMQIKFLSESLSIEGIVFYRCFFGTVFTLLIIYFKKDSAKFIYTQNMVIQFLRAFFGTLAMFFGYSALTLIPIAQASVISFTKVFFVSLLASLILKENVNKTILISGISGFTGILIIMEPNGLDNIYGSTFAMISSIFVACGIICTSFLSRNNKTLTIIFYHSLYSTLICTLFFYSKIPLINNDNIISILLITITAMIGQFFNTESYKFGKTSVIVLLGYSRIIFSFVLGYIFLNEELNSEFFFGVLFILFSSFLSSKEYKK